MARNTGPTLQRRQLGLALRRLREAAGISAIDAGEHIGRSDATISRIETGRVSIRPKILGMLLDLYGVTDAGQREALLAMAQETRQRGWWHSYADAMKARFDHYIGLEAQATSLETYETHYVPGLLQTEDYARAMVQAARVSAQPEEIDRLVAVRMGRQQILTRENPPEVWAVIDEGALRRPAGGPQVMRAQFQRLIEASDLPNVTVQVLPFSAGVLAATSAFVILKFPDNAGPDVVYLEHMTGGLYLDKTADVSAYTLEFNHLRAAARSERDSISLLASMAEEVS